MVEEIVRVKLGGLLRESLVVEIDLDLKLGLALVGHAVLEVVDCHGEVSVVAAYVQELVSELKESEKKSTFFWLNSL